MPPTTSNKRKLPFGGLQRRVRARREPEPEPEEFSDDSQAEGSSEDGDPEDMSDEERQASDASESVSDSEDEEEDPASVVAQISFGALAKAQTSLPSIRQKKGRKGTQDEDEGEKEEHDEPHHSYPDTKSSSKPPKPPKRSSKHAPTEMSSKRQVTRKREVVTTHAVPSRDPRFSAASGQVDEGRSRKAYAFLDEYRDSEMAQLKAAIKKTKSAEEKEGLTRALKSMQSRKEAQARRDAERELISQHRRKEKELVAQGKTPFYLKKAEQKKQLLLDRFAGMKKREVDRTIERRRKKLTSKERKNMPFARRSAAE
ncbi:DUF947-domain-containing protein [Xylariaceae sp. AK1471]|nr:DUF947-domain-containing protein [Xylariaceae sp. AK1471]